MRLRTALLPLYSFVLGLLFKRNTEFCSADIVHAIDSDAIILMSGWRFVRKKFVATIQDYTLLWPERDFDTPRSTILSGGIMHRLAVRVRALVRRGAARRIRNAVCVSTFVEFQTQSAIPGVRTRVIGNCVSPLWNNARRREERDIDILYVGRLAPYKGIRILLRAIRLIYKTRHIRVVVAGDGRLEEYTQTSELMGISDCVRFAGPVRYGDMERLYRQARIVVSPSVWPEPCGRSIIEAMWCGCAVVATRVGGTPEMLVDGTHGFLVPPNRPQTVATACLQLMENDSLRRKIGVRAAVFARRTYRSTVIAAEYMRFYSLIKSGPLIL
jgi:glycosyltransferase involved in cell wall biosynthesis